MRRPMRAFALAATLAVCSAALGTAEDSGELKSSFRVEETDLDLGTVIAGSVATATFVFHNDGPEDVHIIRAKPS